MGYKLVFPVQFLKANYIRDHPLSTYAPRGRGGGYPKAYVVREVA